MYNPEPRTTDKIECSWFANCVNDATGELEHPIIGWVPICDHCLQLVASWGGPQAQVVRVAS